jgi:TonB family protein
MFTLDKFPRSDRPLLPVPPSNPKEPRQRLFMMGALVLLLTALGMLLYKDRGFWFPDTQDAEDQPLQAAPAVGAVPAQSATAIARNTPSAGKTRRARTQVEQPSPDEPSLTPVSITERTVLPPLEVEVVAGESHQRPRAGNNSVHVELQPSSPPEPAPDATDVARADAPASVTTEAAERVQMSADTDTVVSRSVKPGYPLLARQMKVQGSVILRALIGKEGQIQDLRVLSGPPILASAAQEAVKQWHFKPHFEGADAVETQAKITVNFTISTN